MTRHIGIDLGTTNSCISFPDGSEVTIVPTPEGTRVIPSIVALENSEQKIFGNIAKRQFITNNINTIWGIKRLIGNKFNSPEVSEIRKRVGYDVLEAENGDCQVKLGNRHHSPEEISGMFLEYLKTIAEDFLGEEVENAVITVPAFFNDAQRQATKVAGELAGLKVSRIINEPTAALIAYGDRIVKDGLYAVYDLGGGTFDISIVEVVDKVYKVISTFGDTFLGGSDFDVRVIEWVIGEIFQESGIDISGDRNSLQRIIQISEKIKIDLSFNDVAEINIPYLGTLSTGQQYHFSRTITRAMLEEMCEDLVDRTIELIGMSLEEINLKPEDIERILLVGGQSRMPLVASKLQEFFGKDPHLDLNPEEVVSQGAALQAEIIHGKSSEMLLLDVTPLSLGVETKGDRFTKLINRNTTIPVKHSKVFTTISDNQRTVTIHILQGEREIASENKSLGYFNLVGISPAPKGIPQIEVIFEIDANGIVKVSAKDKQTGISQSMRVEPASGLNKEMIQRLISDAKSKKEKDLFKLRLQEVKENIESELASIKIFYQNHVTNLKPKEQNDIRGLMDRAESSLKEDKLEVLEKILLRLNNFRDKMNDIILAKFKKGN